MFRLSVVCFCFWLTGQSVARGDEATADLDGNESRVTCDESEPAAPLPCPSTSAPEVWWDPSFLQHVPGETLRRLGCRSAPDFEPFSLPIARAIPGEFRCPGARERYVEFGGAEILLRALFQQNGDHWELVYCSQEYDFLQHDTIEAVRVGEHDVLVRTNTQWFPEGSKTDVSSIAATMTRFVFRNAMEIWEFAQSPWKAVASGAELQGIRFGPPLPGGNRFASLTVRTWLIHTTDFDEQPGESTRMRRRSRRAPKRTLVLQLLLAEDGFRWVPQSSSWERYKDGGAIWFNEDELKKEPPR